MAGSGGVSAARAVLINCQQPMVLSVRSSMAERLSWRMPLI
jgi:hypothetical protein